MLLVFVATGCLWLGSLAGRLLALVPLLGTMAFLIATLPFVGDQILHAEHYGDKTAVEAFDPIYGLRYSAQSVVENVALGTIGIGCVSLPIWVVYSVWPLLLIGGVWWWLGVKNHRLMILAFGFLFLTYFLIYGARKGWEANNMTTPTWSRYHLLPQLGLALFLSAGLSRWQKRFFPQ